MCVCVCIQQKYLRSYKPYIMHAAAAASSHILNAPPRKRSRARHDYILVHSQFKRAARGRELRPSFAAALMLVVSIKYKFNACIARLCARARMLYTYNVLYAV